MSVIQESYTRIGKGIDLTPRTIEERAVDSQEIHEVERFWTSGTTIPLHAQNEKSLAHEVSVKLQLQRVFSQAAEAHTQSQEKPGQFNPYGKLSTLQTMWGVYDLSKAPNLPQSERRAYLEAMAHEFGYDTLEQAESLIHQLGPQIQALEDTEYLQIPGRRSVESAIAHEINDRTIQKKVDAVKQRAGEIAGDVVGTAALYASREAGTYALGAAIYPFVADTPLGDWIKNHPFYNFVLSEGIFYGSMYLCVGNSVQQSIEKTGKSLNGVVNGAHALLKKSFPPGETSRMDINSLRPSNETLVKIGTKLSPVASQILVDSPVYIALASNFVGQGHPITDVVNVGFFTLSVGGAAINVVNAEVEKLKARRATPLERTNQLDDELQLAYKTLFPGLQGINDYNLHD